MSLLRLHAARLIHGPRNNFKVRRVAAMTHAAQMIEFHASRNRTVNPFEGPAVGEYLLLADTEIPVAITNLSRLPQPARPEILVMCRYRAIAVNF